jgi:hypothetical protein
MSSKKLLRSAFGMVGSVTAAASAFTSLRSARHKKDRLLLANALASVAVAITGALIAVRAMRKGDDS